MSNSPGPWKMHKHLSAKLKYRYSFQSRNGDTVCRIVSSDMDDTEVETANANIIQAAPQMLEALQEDFYQASGQYEKKKCGHNFFCTCPSILVKAAIAKALGQA